MPWALALCMRHMLLPCEFDEQPSFTWQAGLQHSTQLLLYVPCCNWLPWLCLCAWYGTLLTLLVGFAESK